MNMDDETSPTSSTNTTSTIAENTTLPTPDLETSGISIRKSRRKTALPEELLHKKAKTPTDPSAAPSLAIDNDGFAIPDSLPSIAVSTTASGKDADALEAPEGVGGDKSLRLADKFQIDEKTMQKLIDLEKTLKDRKTVTGAPSSASSSLSVRDKDAEMDSRGRSGSFTEDPNPVNQTLPAPGSFQRNTRMTKSARPFGKSASGGSLKGGITASSRKQNSLSKNSPLMERKSAGEPTSTTTSSSDMDSNDVFKRLTSNLPPESDPDLGQILPSKASPGKPESLTCMYTATGHSSAILSLDVRDYLMITGSKDRTAKCGT